MGSNEASLLNMHTLKSTISKQQQKINLDDASCTTANLRDLTVYHFDLHGRC